MNVLVPALAALALAAWFAPPLLHRAAQAARVRAAARGSRRVALTYDDGPGPSLTPPLLELLAEHQAPATFFLLGRRAEASPELARGLRSAGHEVGLHSFDHLHAWKALPWQAARDLLRDGWAKDTLGLAPRLVRPPYGKMTLATWLGALLGGRRIAWWTIDSGDTWPGTPDPEAIADRVVRAGGGVVLLHDFDRDGHADRDGRHAYVLDVTRAILDRGREAGLTFCRYSDLCSRTGGRADRA